MFDDGKYMAKEAVDRNNALADLDQQRSEDTVRAWSRNVAVRRGVSVLLALVTVAIPIVTGLSAPRVFVAFVLVDRCSGSHPDGNASQQACADRAR